MFILKNGGNIKILGIHTGHDATIAIVDDFNILGALSKERITRIKNDPGFFAIDHILKLTKTKPEEIDAVAFGGYCNANRLYNAMDIFSKLKHNQNLYFTLKKKLAYFLFAFDNPVFIYPNRWLAHREIKRNLKKYLKTKKINKPLFFIDHHMAHAASAFFTSGWKDALIITADGTGDLLSITVNIGKDTKIKKVHQVKSKTVSLGEFYSSITKHFGFTPNKHEGKITGLAAYGNADIFYDKIKCQAIFKNNTITSNIDYMIGFKGKIKGFLKGLAAKYDYYLSLVYPKKKDINKDLAAAYQKRLEDVIVPFIGHYVKKYKTSQICLAGGIFANVRVNQKIRELPGVENIYVHPAMGDTGLAAGAALYVAAKKNPNLSSKFLKTIYFGPEYSEKDMKKAIKDHGLEKHAKKYKNPEKKIAELVNKGKIVGIFRGRMEYGPRALGNRTIFADPRDKTINDSLNKRLKRTEFMPFAPSILEEYTHEWFKEWKKDHLAARFMTITYDVFKDKQKKASAIVHIDGTARPQVVRKKDNPKYWKIINEFRKITGLPIIINTSFNVHEEPIVCSPDDAIRSFKKKAIDVLLLGDYIIQ